MLKRAEHLYLLDILRGMASLSVVLWHYQHFFFQPGTGLPSDFDRSIQPFYSALSLFYNEGSRAVQLFFVLSGFIFFFQYAEKIRTRAVDTKSFFVLRFSRLYPLHAVTLVIVAIGQIAAVAMTDNFFVFQCNNSKRFVLSALFLTDWLPERYVCGTFNGPVWSLSVEVFLYMIFFGFARSLPKRWAAQLTLTALVVAGSIVVYLGGGYHLLGEPTLCFFAGGLVYLSWSRLPNHSRMNLSVIFASLFMCIASLLYMKVDGASRMLLGLCTFPSLVLALACAQNYRHSAGRSIRVVGDITYSTYLLHFPIQLLLMLAATVGSVSIDFRSNLVWVGFFILLIAVSLLSFNYFERPAQSFLRRVMLKSERPNNRHSSAKSLAAE